MVFIVKEKRPHPVETLLPHTEVAKHFG